MRTYRTVRFLIIAVALAVSVRPVKAQQSSAPAASAPASDPQAITLVQRSLAALTGGAQVSDVTLSGTARQIAGSNDESGSVTLMATSLGDSRINLALSSGGRSEIRNHSAIPLAEAFPPSMSPEMTQAVRVPQAAGAWSGPDGVLHGIAGHNTLTDSGWFFPAITLANISSSSNYILLYLGQEVSPTGTGRNVIHVVASRQIAPPNASLPATSSFLPATFGTSVSALVQHLSQMDLYFDPSTSLPVALVFNVHPDQNSLIDLATLVQYSSYEQVNGVSVPFHVQKYLNNGLVLDLQLTNAYFNSGLSATTFQLQ